MKYGAGIALLILAVATGAQAKARVSVAIEQFREAPENKAGAKLVPATSVSPGDVVEYVLTYSNKGDEPATNAVIEDPIPTGTTLLANTASGAGAEITFSIDGGKTFAPPVTLTYDVKLPSGASERRVALPSEYTNVRWTIARIAPGASGKVMFRVRVH